MPLVVLVHGAWHRGSSWAAVVSELAALGSPALAVDLPAEQPLGLQVHAEVVEAGIAAAGMEGEHVVLVGHSLAGLVVPVVAQRLGPDRVVGLVLLGALIPRPGMSFRDQSRAEPGLMVEGFGPGQRRQADGSTF